jgi:tripartite-type tricarboxylate transporter receptor subunit TctC
MMRRNHTFLLLGFMLFTALFFITTAASAAETFPSRPVTLIVPYPAGGATDLLTRPLADEAKKPLGQSVIVENRAGGAGAVGVGAIVGKNPWRACTGTPTSTSSPSTRSRT